MLNFALRKNLVQAILRMKHIMGMMPQRRRKRRMYSDSIKDATKTMNPQETVRLLYLYKRSLDRGGIETIVKFLG